MGRRAVSNQRSGRTGATAQESLGGRKCEERAGCQDSHVAIARLVEVAGGGVDGEKVVGLAGQRAFEDSVVRLVSDGGRREQRQAEREVPLDFFEQQRRIAQDTLVLRQHLGGDVRVEQVAQAQLDDHRGLVGRIRQRGELQHAGIKDDSQDKAAPRARRVCDVYVPQTRPPASLSWIVLGSDATLAPDRATVSG